MRAYLPHGRVRNLTISISVGRANAATGGQTPQLVLKDEAQTRTRR